MDSLLDLQIVRGPLSADDGSAVLRAYNRLAQAEIPPANFQRWLCASPSGPAVHAMLRTSSGEIVAHLCVFPFPLHVFGRTVTAAKAEYLFVEPEYRRAIVRGFEASGQPPAMVLLRQLYDCVQNRLAWDPVFISAVPGAEALHRFCGARPVVFPLTECLFVRRPWRAARATPNLSRKQRLAMLIAGIGQAALSVGYRLLPWTGRGALGPASEPGRDLENALSDKIAFGRQHDYLQWRYPQDQFAYYLAGDSPADYVIARRGSPHQFLRVCSARITSGRISPTRLLADLLSEARKHQALGLRWAVYGDAESAKRLVARFRRGGCVCAPRTRTILLLTRRQEIVDPSVWLMEDSLTAFEH